MELDRSFLMRHKCSSNSRENKSNIDYKGSLIIEDQQVMSIGGTSEGEDNKQLGLPLLGDLNIAIQK